LIEDGHALPNANLARVEGTELLVHNIRDAVQEVRCLIIGLPGCFTPVCTGQHLPSVAERLPRLRKAGITRFLVVAPDNPWVVQKWAATFPFQDEFDWYSDGNLDFTRKCGLLENGRSYFLGECSKRYAIQTNDVLVERVSVERSINKVTCTAGETQLAGSPPS
jgi:peroxiredoxin